MEPKNIQGVLHKQMKQSMNFKVFVPNYYLGHSENQEKFTHFVGDKMVFRFPTTSEVRARFEVELN